MELDYQRSKFKSSPQYVAGVAFPTKTDQVTQKVRFPSELVVPFKELQSSPLSKIISSTLTGLMSKRECFN
jgi:hypothetical protein